MGNNVPAYDPAYSDAGAIFRHLGKDDTVWVKAKVLFPDVCGDVVVEIGDEGYGVYMKPKDVHVIRGEND